MSAPDLRAAIEGLRREHVVSFDTGCARAFDESKACTCGADEHNASVDAALRLLDEHGRHAASMLDGALELHLVVNGVRVKIEGGTDHERGRYYAMRLDGRPRFLVGDRWLTTDEIQGEDVECEHATAAGALAAVRRALASDPARAAAPEPIPCPNCGSYRITSHVVPAQPIHHGCNNCGHGWKGDTARKP